MKKILFILFVCVISVSVAQTQESVDDPLGLLFENYEDAIVYLKGSTYTEEKVNFNFLENKMLFVDKADGLVKVLPSTDNILSVNVKNGNRRFIFDRDGLKEIISDSPEIYVQYNAKIRTKAQKGGYGTSETSNITSYSDIRHQGQISVLKNLDREISSYYNYYWIVKDGKKKKFTDFKGFLKIYSKHKDILGKYIEENEINFEDTSAIVSLCQYAENL